MEKTNKNIQALRGIAAFLVVLHHYVPHYVAQNGFFQNLDVIRGFTFFRVDIFFVISGYVIAMTTAYSDRDFPSAQRFIRNRLSRIYLGYWPFFFLMLVFVAKYQPWALQKASFWESLFLLTPDIDKLVLKISWTLSYELYFYVMCFLLFWVSRDVLVRVMIVGVIVIASCNLFVDFGRRSSFNFFMSPFLIEFFSGYILFHVGRC